MLDEFLENLGYSTFQIQIIHNMYPNRMYKESTLLYNLKNLYNYLNKNNISNKEFIYITTTVPSIISLSLEEIKLKISDLSDLGFNRINSFKLLAKYPYIIEINKSTLKNNLNSFKKLGFKDTEINKIIINNPYLLQGNFSNYKNILDYFNSMGYSDNNILRLITKMPEVLDLSINELDKSFKKIKKIGFSDTDIIKMTNVLPDIIVSNKNIITDYFNDLLDFGYSEIDIIEIIKKIPIIFKDIYLKDIKNKLDNFIELGFTDKQIIFMTCNNPYLFLYSIDNINNIYNNLLSLKYSKEDVIKICNNFPTIFGYNFEYTLDKINYYKKIGLNEYLIDNSKILLIPIEIIHNRYLCISKVKNIDDNYKDLFIEDSKFYKKYKITKEELLKGDF